MNIQVPADATIIQLPFPGFYDSWYSQEVDSIAEREAENLVEGDDNQAQPEGLRLDAGDYADILLDVTDHSAAYHEVAREYVQAFDSYWSEEIGLSLGLTFETMKSPREYNFATDRVFAYVAPATLRALFALSANDGHATLGKTIADRFTSRSGFMSFYSNQLDAWLAQPLNEWDHNELDTLLLAVMALHAPDDTRRGDSWDYSLFSTMAENETFYTAHSNAVDWAALDAKVNELREEKRAAQLALDPDYVAPPVRCDRTLDLFTGREG